MFWCEKLEANNNYYCTCQTAWLKWQIVHEYISTNVLEVYMTPENGMKCLIYRSKRGVEHIRQTEFTFSGWQHVKVEVIGGNITIAGSCDADMKKNNESPNKINMCPFINVEKDAEWLQKLVADKS